MFVSISSPSSEGGGTVIDSRLYDEENQFPLVLLQAKVVGGSLLLWGETNWVSISSPSSEGGGQWKLTLLGIGLVFPISPH